MAFEFFAIEEHFLEHGLQGENEKNKTIDSLDPKLQDDPRTCLDSVRANQIAFQIISPTPLDHIPTANEGRKANKQLASFVKQNPPRYVAFALIPMHDPHTAVKVLRHAVETQGFRGALLPSTFPKDDEFSFGPIFAEAERLDAPFYLSPAGRSKNESSDKRNHPASLVATSCAQILHLFSLGVFHQFPGLKFLISDMDSMTPYMLLRMLADQSFSDHSRGKSLAQVWEQNVWVLTSNLMSLAAFECLLKVVPSEHVMYRAEDEEDGEDLVERIKQEGILKGKELEQFCFRNAERLLGIKNCEDAGKRTKTSW